MKKSTVTLNLPAERGFSRVASQTAASIAALVSGNAAQEESGRDFAHAFELALSEAFTNSVKHAPESATPPTITLIFELEERQLTVSVRDTNAPFSIETAAPDLEHYPENGYGLMIIRKVMDNVTYRRDGDTNIISMSKTL